MSRARIQRHLAAAGLSLVTGTAAIGIAIAGVGPLGEVAASVRGAGISLGRSVLSVVVPETADTPDSAPAQASPSPEAAKAHGGPAPAARTAPRSAPHVPPVQDTAAPRGGDQSDLPVPPIGPSPADDGAPVAEVDELVTAPAPQAQASQGGDAPPDAPVLRGLAGDTLR
jgi:hypothetical protein